MMSSDIYNEMTIVPISEPLSELIVSRLRDSTFASLIAFGEAPRVVARGPAYRPAALEEFHRLSSASQAKGIAISGNDQVAVATDLTEKTAVLEVGDVDLDVKSDTQLIVTKDRKYSTPLGCIELDSHAQLLECFCHKIDAATVAAPCLPLKQPSPFKGEQLSGAYMPAKFCNILAVFCEHVLRLHVLFSSEASAPRRLFIDSVMLIDLKGAQGGLNTTLLTCKFHAASGRCICKSRKASANHPASQITLTIRFCGGEIGPAGHCRECGFRPDEGCERCGNNFEAPTLMCKHVKNNDSRFNASKIQLERSDFLRLFAVGCVAIRHAADEKSTLLWNDRLEAALDDAVTKYQTGCGKSASELAVHDQIVESMLSEGSFSFNVKKGSLSRAGGKIKKWQRSTAVGFSHLFLRTK